MEFRSYENEILEKVRRIKEQCPNFYITGNSVPALEKLGLEIAKVIKEEKLMPFKGVVPYFTIKMPYFSDRDTAVGFLLRMKESYSIARDCYDCYEGIVLVEMSEEWIKKGDLSLIHMFLDYVQNHEKTCFIVLVPGKGEKESCFYSEFIRCGIWMRIQSETPSVEQCMNEFQRTAKQKGFEITDNAKSVLQKRLTERSESEIENFVIVQQLLKQIMFNRTIEQSKNRMIEEKDIIISGSQKHPDQRKIGFTVERK